jgi:predicted transcriptional regulator
MSTLSVRLPDDIAERLKNLANKRNVSVNKLMNELSTRALLEEEARQQFLAAQLRGSRKRGLKMLDELDALGK